MNIGLPVQSNQKTGGGWSFVDNLTKGLNKQGHNVVGWKDADIVLIPSASMCQHDLFDEMNRAGKKIVLRVDNALRDSRNRGTGMTRLKRFAQAADKVVYQSRWSYKFLSPFIDRLGPIIHNSVDETIFQEEGPYKDMQNKGIPIYMYSRYNRDESKMWIRAWYDYIKIQQEEPQAFLLIVGRFSDVLREYKFDFYAGENFEYYGIAQSAEEMAQLYRGTDYLLATYHRDCFSNTYVEALMCGVDLYKPDKTGGTSELIYQWGQKGRDYFSLERMTNDYLNLFSEL